MLRKSTKIFVDFVTGMVYNNITRSYGPVPVSTGNLKYDKRGKPGNLVNCPT